MNKVVYKIYGLKGSYIEFVSRMCDIVQIEIEMVNTVAWIGG